MIWLARAAVEVTTARHMGFKDCYDWHQAVWQMFPDRPNDSRCFLFRVDRKEAKETVLLIATEKPQRPGWCGEPDWSCRELESKFFEHSFYRFDLRANVTKRDKARDIYGGRESKGRRFVITDALEQRNWLVRKGEEHGFKLHEDEFWGLEIDEREDFRFRKGKEEEGLLVGVRFRGVIQVTDQQKFQQAIGNGIGPARGLGFGLMMIQPISI